MLSPHELAALMHILNDQDHSGLNPNDLSVLVNRQLVRLEELAQNGRRLHLTPQGRHILESIAKRR